MDGPIASTRCVSDGHQARVHLRIDDDDRHALFRRSDDPVDAFVGTDG